MKCYLTYIREKCNQELGTSPFMIKVFLPSLIKHHIESMMIICLITASYTFQMHAAQKHVISISISMVACNQLLVKEQNTQDKLAS